MTGSRTSQERWVLPGDAQNRPTATGSPSAEGTQSPAGAGERQGNGANWTSTDAFEFLAGVSHELSSPLTVIKANTECIRQFVEEHRTWSPELIQRVDDVELAVERILRLRGDLMTASRHELPQLEVCPVHVNHVIERVVRGQRAGALDKGITLTEEYTADVSYAMCDDGAAESIFGNLLANAIRYTPAGGTIRIRTHTTDSYVVLEFADSGIGIAAEEQALIFERFYRTQDARIAVPFGTGLGLALVQELVQACDGSISVASRPGVGSTFTVALPVAELAANEL